MNSYRVIWEIDIQADSAVEAAQKAIAIQLRADSIANVFTVENRDDGTDGLVDLSAEEDVLMNAARRKSVAAVTQAAQTFEASKLVINRKRFSTTQGEVELIYDGRRLGQYGDKIKMNSKGEWHGQEDSYWLDVAGGIVRSMVED